MACFGSILLIFICICVDRMLCQLSDDKDVLLNWCLESKNHKRKPGEEDALHGQCEPWKGHSCCTKEVSLDIHEKDMYNFTMDHCLEQTGKKMSEKCRNYFTQDNCFYECEPHIGFWVVKTNRKIASERFHKVPLCANVCEEWFDACKNDFTCAYNWPRDFKFSKGHNFCQENATCTSFKAMYGTAKDFCENVWDHSWVYTTNDKPCMQTWFNASMGNPNRQVAEYYIKERFGGTASSLTLCFWLFSLLLTLSVSKMVLH